MVTLRRPELVAYLPFVRERSCPTGWCRSGG